MANKVQVDINAKDNTSSAFQSVSQKLGSLGRSVGALATLEVGKKIIEGLGKLGQASSAVSAQAGKNFEGLSNALNGVAAEAGAAIFGNNDFIKSIRSMIGAITPLITTLLKGLVPVITSVISGFNSMFNALRPGVEYILSYTIPVFQRLGTVAQLVGNAFQLAGAYVTGNTEKIKKYREENAKLLKDLTAPIVRAKVDLTPANVSKLETIGAKVGQKDTPKKVVDADKLANDRFKQLLQLQEAGQLERKGIDELAVAYANYSFTLRNTNATLEDRAEALSNVQAYDKLAADAAAKHTKELEEQAKALDALVKRENDRVSALTKLVKDQGKNASKEDRQTLADERDAAQSELLTAKNPVDRLRLTEQIDAINDALKIEASKLEQSIADSLGSAVQNGLEKAFSGDFSGMFSSFYDSIKGGIAKGMTSITLEMLKRTGLFISIQSKLLAGYAAAMKVVAAALSNPYTAAIGAAVASVALAALVRGFAGSTRGGGSSYVGGSYSTGATQDQLAASRTPLTINIQGGLLDMSSPDQRRSLRDAFQELVKGRDVILAGAY